MGPPELAATQNKMRASNAGGGLMGRVCRLTVAVRRRGACPSAHGKRRSAAVTIMIHDMTPQALRLAKTERLQLKGPKIQLRIWFTVRDQATVE